MEKIISILIPTFNMEKYLRKCLDSLIVSDENMNILEVIIINDGSKDSSSQIAHEYEKRFPDTFRIIDKENGNYGSCINRGLAEMTGKYVKVLDADDSFDSIVFNDFISFLLNANVDLVINDYSIVNLDYNITETYTFDLPKSFDLAEMSQPTISWLWHHGITYNRELFQLINYHQTEGISYTDDEWIFQPMSVVKKCAYFQKNLYFYLMGREGQTFDPNQLKKSFGQRITVAKGLIYFFKTQVCKCNDGQKRYLILKLLSRLIPIYDFYLCKEYTEEGREEIIQFDIFVKREVPVFYLILNNQTDRFCRAISRWQISGYGDPLYFRLKRIFFKLCILLRRPYRNLHMPDSVKRKK